MVWFIVSAALIGEDTDELPQPGPFIFLRDASTDLFCMMTSSNGNIFRVTGPLCGEFTGPGECPTQRPVMLSFDVYFDLRLNKRLSKQSWGWWFETLSRSLWRHRNGFAVFRDVIFCHIPAFILTFKVPQDLLRFHDHFKWLHLVNKNYIYMI